MSNYINLFNKNIESLLINIKENFSETKKDVEDNYSLPIQGDGYILQFIQKNKTKGTDIANKNDIIFSKGSNILNNIDLHYIWNHENMTQPNKDIIWKYIQSLYLYSLEYSENIDFKKILRTYNETKIINNDMTRNVVHIFNNLSNKKVDNSELTITSTDDSDESKGAFPFKMPDLSSFLGAHLMEFINNIVKNIDIDSLELNNPLELVQLLLSGEFDLQKDTTGVSTLVKNTIDVLKNELLLESLDREALFKDIENLLSLINTFTNNNYNIKNIIPDIHDKDFNDNFNKIIKAIDFEMIINTFVVKLKEIKDQSDIDIGQLFEQIMKDYSNDNLNISSLISTLMKVMSSVQAGASTATDTATATATDTATATATDTDTATPSLDLNSIISNVMGGLGNNSDNDSLDLNSIISNVMGGLGNNNNDVELNKNDNDLDLNSIISNIMGDLGNNNNVDLNNIIQSVTKNLPADMSRNSNISDVLNNSNLDELKNMIPSSSKQRINTSKLQQLSRLEKRREILRQKLKKRKQSLNLQ
jgi:hypothetical protein